MVKPIDSRKDFEKLLRLVQIKFPNVEEAVKLHRKKRSEPEIS